MTSEVYTISAAATKLQLHTKTLLRYVREGRLPATKIGKEYRILGSDLAAFVGAIPQRPLHAARVTAIADVADVDQEMFRRLTATVVGAGKGHSADNPLSVDVAHDPVHRSVKIIAHGSPGDVAGVLTLVDACLSV